MIKKIAKYILEARMSILFVCVSIVIIYLVGGIYIETKKQTSILEETQHSIGFSTYADEGEEDADPTFPQELISLLEEYNPPITSRNIEVKPSVRKTRKIGTYGGPDKHPAFIYDDGERMYTLITSLRSMVRLPPLSVDKALAVKSAGMAENLAKRCRPENKDGFISTAVGDPSDAIVEWANLVKYAQVPSYSCADGVDCTPWWELVKKEARSIGCGYDRCTGGGEKYIVVCFVK